MKVDGLARDGVRPEPVEPAQDAAGIGEAQGDPEQRSRAADQRHLSEQQPHDPPRREPKGREEPKLPLPCLDPEVEELRGEQQGGRDQEEGEPEEEPAEVGGRVAGAPRRALRNNRIATNKKTVKPAIVWGVG